MKRPRFATRIFVVAAVVMIVTALTWLIAVEVAHDEPFQAPGADTLLLAAAVFLVVATPVTWLLAKRVARPVEELADAADAISSGTYMVPVPDAGSSEELRRIIDAFSRMSARLSDTEASRVRLLSDLAHEIRTPLATLEAYIDGLEDGVVASDSSSWSTMRDQVLRLRRLTADLRETAAAEEHALNLKLESTDLSEVIGAAAEAVAPRSRSKDIEVATTGLTKPVLVKADADRLKQVLANLLDNAIRHTPPGGHVVVSLASESKSAVVSVSDDGDGVPKDQLELIFARFHRVDSSRRSADGSGSGLGLTIARAIVSDHGGTIVASSAGEGRGTTFTIRLPIASQKGANAR